MVKEAVRFLTNKERTWWGENVRWKRRWKIIANWKQTVLKIGQWNKEVWRNRKAVKREYKEDQKSIRQTRKELNKYIVTSDRDRWALPGKCILGSTAHKLITIFDSTEALSCCKWMMGFSLKSLKKSQPSCPQNLLDSCQHLLTYTFLLFLSITNASLLFL